MMTINDKINDLFVKQTAKVMVDTESQTDTSFESRKISPVRHDSDFLSVS